MNHFPHILVDPITSFLENIHISCELNFNLRSFFDPWRLVLLIFNGTQSLKYIMTWICMLNIYSMGIFATKEYSFICKQLTFLNNNYKKCLFISYALIIYMNQSVICFDWCTLYQLERTLFFFPYNNTCSNSQKCNTKACYSSLIENWVMLWLSGI